MATLNVDIALSRRDFLLEVAFEVERSLALIGPSGGGKTSVLRAIAGLERPRAGTIRLGDETWFEAGGVNLPPDARSVGFVFQDYALFPHMDVVANVGFGARRRAEEVMERVGINHLARAYPKELSGGERQRVAVARALAREPAVLLLDEPTAALDVVTRDSVRAELVSLVGETGVPTIVVTHDIGEAAMFATAVGVMVDGRIRQIGRGAEVLGAPVDGLVARLVGHNVIDGVAVAGQHGVTDVTIRGGGRLSSTDRLVGPVDVLVHPAHIMIGATGDERTTNRFVGSVANVASDARGTRIHVGPFVADVPAEMPTRRPVTVGEVVTLSFPWNETRLVARERGAGEVV